jgi:hypothetical protein
MQCTPSLDMLSAVTPMTETFHCEMLCHVVAMWIGPDVL